MDGIFEDPAPIVEVKPNGKEIYYMLKKIPYLILDTLNVLIVVEAVIYIDSN
jgi:hypothetical protein